MPTVDTLCINDPTTTHQMIMLFGETFVTVAYLIILHILYCSTLIAKIRLLVDLYVNSNLIPLFYYSSSTRLFSESCYLFFFSSKQ